MTKLCTNCKFHQKAYSDWCNAERRSIGISPVNGREEFRGTTYCSIARWPSGSCGPDARLFQPKKSVVPSNTKLPWWKRVFK